MFYDGGQIYDHRGWCESYPHGRRHNHETRPLNIEGYRARCFDNDSRSVRRMTHEKLQREYQTPEVAPKAKASSAPGGSLTRPIHP